MSKIKDLPEITDLNDNDLVYAVDTSEGANGGRKITKANLKNTVAQTPSEIKSSYESNSNTNAFTDSEKDKLANIESGATADQTSAEVSYDNDDSSLDATNVKAALDELDAEKEPLIAKNTAFNKNFGTGAGEVVEGNDPRLTYQQMIHVKLNAGVGEFSSVKAAVESITDASATKPYLVYVGPGIYFEDPFTLPPYIDIRGEQETTVLRPNDNDNNFITLAGNNSINQLKIHGPTSLGCAALYKIGGTGGSAIRDITFGDSNCFINLDTTGGNPSIIASGLIVPAGTDFVTGFSIQGSGTGVLDINELGVGISGVGIDPTNLLYGSGSGNFLSTSSVKVLVTPPASLENCFLLENGVSLFSTAVTCSGANNMFNAPNVGAGQNLTISAALSIGAINNAITVQNPNALGFISGSFDATKVDIDDNALVTLTFTDDTVASTGFVVLGNILQADTNIDNKLDITKIIRKTTPLGLVNGGEITDSGLDNVINVAAGSGFLFDTTDQVVKEVSWPATQVNVPTGTFRYIVVSSNGVVSASAAAPIDNTREILLGRAGARFGPISFIEKIEFNANHLGNKIEDYLRSAIGPIYNTGSLVTENVGTPYHIDVSSGNYFYGTNEYTPSGGTDISFIKNFRDGIGGFNQIFGINSIPLEYDNGTGTPQAIGAGKFVKHAFYIVGDGANESYGVVLGQQQFDSLLEAEEGDLPSPPTVFTDSFTLIASIIVQEGNSNIAQIDDERPVIGFKASGVSASSTHGNLFGLNQDDHPQYLLTNGGRALTGNLDLGGNNITNVNTINNVDITSHAARHLPNGLDALATAAPSTNLNGNTTNSVGVENSFSRSDHTHAINVATPSVAGLMSGTDKTKLNGIESGATADTASVVAPPDVAATGSAGTDTNTYANANHTHAHGNQAGGSLHAVATQSVNGFLSSADKTKIDQNANAGWLQYSNVAAQTNGTSTFAAINFATDRESFANSLFTKVNATDFRADFTGTVEVSFNVGFFAANNDRAAEFVVNRAGVDIPWTQRIRTSKDNAGQATSTSGTFLLNCTTNDIFQLRFRAPNGDTTITIPIDKAVMSLKVIRKTS